MAFEGWPMGCTLVVVAAETMGCSLAEERELPRRAAGRERPKRAAGRELPKRLAGVVGSFAGVVDIAEGSPTQRRQWHLRRARGQKC